MEWQDPPREFPRLTDAAAAAAREVDLQHVGVLEGPVRNYPSFLKDSEIEVLRSQLIVFKRDLPRISTESAPDEQCPLGGIVDRSAQGLWSSNDGVALDDILEKYFTDQTHNAYSYALKSDFITKLTCADIADVLSFNVSVQRSHTWNTLIVRKLPNCP